MFKTESEAGASNKRVVIIIIDEVVTVRKIIPFTEHLFCAKHIKALYMYYF